VKTALFCFALFIGQLPTLQDKPIVHLRPHQDFIPAEFGGDLVEFTNPPPVIQLPQLPPVKDPHGRPWQIELRNMGPGTVTIMGKAQFSLQIPVGKTVTIKSNDGNYVFVR
jgi:hypothetical protein